MIRIAIVEDNKKDRSLLQEIFKRYESETGETVQVSAFDRAETFLYGYKPVYDVVFLDIMLPNMNGMEVAEQLRKYDSEVAIIFVTDMRQFAIQGYKVNALDYFIKPASYFDVKLRLDKVRLMKQLRLPSVVIHIPGQGDLAMSSDEVYYIEVMDKELTYHTRKGNFLARSVGLKKLEKELAASGFFRCSSSYLVNLKLCKELRGDEVIVGEGDILKISRGMKSQFVTKLSETFIRIGGGYKC